MSRRTGRNIKRLDRIKGRTALAHAKAKKRKWLVFLLLAAAAIAAVVFAVVKFG